MQAIFFPLVYTDRQITERFSAFFMVCFVFQKSLVFRTFLEMCEAQLQFPFVSDKFRSLSPTDVQNQHQSY